MVLNNLLYTTNEPEHVYKNKPKIIISAVGETVCRASVVVVVLRDALVEVFKAAQNVLYL